MRKQVTPSPWVPKIELSDCGDGHHEISIVHAMDPWEKDPELWTDEEFEGHKQTTKWIVTLGALTLGPLLADIEVARQLHRCPPLSARTKDGVLYKDFSCCLSIKTAETIMGDCGSGSYICIPSSERKEWVAKVADRLAAVAAQMRADW